MQAEQSKHRCPLPIFCPAVEQPTTPKGSGHHCPTPASTIPPLVNDKGLKGKSRGSDKTPTLTTSRRRRMIPHKVKGKKPAAGAVHPTACVVSRSSSGASYESFLLRFFYVLPPPFNEVVNYDAEQGEGRGRARALALVLPMASWQKQSSLRFNVLVPSLASSREMMVLLWRRG
jgi:hypothetical protein